MGLVLVVIFVVCTVNYVREPNLIPSPAGLNQAGVKSEPLRPAPELAEDRKVTEQDCSKPVDLSAGNLRCK
jgi:hypothetical protein